MDNSLYDLAGIDDGNLLAVIGHNVKAFRKEKHISQVQLAGMLQFQKASMSRIEAGKTNLKIFSLYQIALALEVSVDELLKDVKALHPPGGDRSLKIRREKFFRYSNRITELNHQFKALMRQISDEQNYLQRIELHRQCSEIIESIGKINRQIANITIVIKK